MSPSSNTHSQDNITATKYNQRFEIHQISIQHLVNLNIHAKINMRLTPF